MHEQLPSIAEDAGDGGERGPTLRDKLSQKWFVGGGELPLVLKLEIKQLSDKATCLMADNLRFS